MNRLLAYTIAAAALATAPSAASATTLFDKTNLADQTNTPESLVFTPGSTSTTLSIGGFNVPSFINLTDIELTRGTTNVLGQTFTFTSAGAGCTDASQGGPGAFGTNNISLGSVCVGVNDTFSQTISTTPGELLVLRFLLSNSNAPNGLLITASDATTGVPEPATWAMMLLGFGAVGLSLRFRRKKVLAIAAA
jgi:hypothetical protein